MTPPAAQGGPDGDGPVSDALVADPAHAEPVPTIGDSLRALAAGEVTSVELVHRARRRHDARASLDPFVLLNPDAADDAAASDARRADGAALGPLDGVVVAVKDVVDMVGLPTRHGSEALPETPADRDDITVARLRAAGAVIVGKTRGPELSIFGSSDQPTGAAANPWDPRRVSGGSSGGSAVAVAAGMVSAALGSDGLGSVRIPAGACGCVGIKPGSGVVPMQVGDAEEHWFGMTQYGPIATTVEDAARLLDVLAASGDRFTTAAATPLGRSLRIGVCVTAPTPLVWPSRSAVRSVGGIGALLRDAGHVVRRIDVPWSTSATRAVIARWTVGTRNDATTLGLDLDAAQPRTRRHVAVGERLGDGAVREQDRQDWQRALAGVFAEVDVLLTPMTNHAPPMGLDWHDRSWLANVVSNGRWAPWAAPFNLADVPAGTVPGPLDDDGLPTGVHAVVPWQSEDLLVQVLAELERLRPWRRLAP